MQLFFISFTDALCDILSHDFLLVLTLKFLAVMLFWGGTDATCCIMKLVYINSSSMVQTT